MKALIEWLGQRIESLAQMLIDFLTDIWSAFVAIYLQSLSYLELLINILSELFWNYLNALFEQVWIKATDAVVYLWDKFYHVVEPWYVAIRDDIATYLGEAKDGLIDWMKGLEAWPRIQELIDAASLAADAYADAAWLLPLNQCIAIFAATVVVIVIIRLLRWVLSFIWITG